MTSFQAPLLPRMWSCAACLVVPLIGASCLAGPGDLQSSTCGSAKFHWNGGPLTSLDVAPTSSEVAIWSIRCDDTLRCIYSPLALGDPQQAEEVVVAPRVWTAGTYTVSYMTRYDDGSRHNADAPLVLDQDLDLDADGAPLDEALCLIGIGEDG